MAPGSSKAFPPRPCSAPPLKPPLPGSQESTASPAPATSSVSPALCGTPPRMSRVADTWPHLPPCSSQEPLHSPSPSGAISSPGFYFFQTATWEGHRHCALSWSQTTQMPCPNLTQQTTLWTVSACGPSSTLTGAAQPWPCSASQDPAPHQPGRASSRQPSKCPCASDLLTGPLTQRAEPRSSQEPGLHPSRANSTNRHPPTLASPACRALCPAPSVPAPEDTGSPRRTP